MRKLRRLERSGKLKQVEKKVREFVYRCSCHQVFYDKNYKGQVSSQSSAFLQQPQITVNKPGKVV